MKVPEVSPVFVELIRQINLTSPDLVVNTGDLIWGHCDWDMAVREWDANGFTGQVRLVLSARGTRPGIPGQGCGLQVSTVWYVPLFCRDR